MATTEPFALEPAEAVKWFREKGYAPAFDYRDVWGEQHARAFTVAKATQLDVLADLRFAVDHAIKSGQTVQQFRKDLKPTLQAKGWWGEKEMVDPDTGETTTVQLGSAQRLRTIYETNLRQAHAAGRWQRVERTAKARPFLRYVCVDDDNVRASHKQWHNLVRPWDDPIWNKIAPPNGWGCRCKLQQLSERDLGRYNLKVSAELELEEVTHTNVRTGEVRRVPRGVTPGFDYNPGRSRGFTPPDSAPPLSEVRGVADYKRPAIGAVRGQPKAPPKWPEAHGPADARRTKDRFKELFGADEGIAKDPLGVEVTFNQRYLDHLLDKEPARVAFVPAAKAAVEKPYEIWMMPVRLADGSVQMRLRYVGVFEGQNVVTIVDRSRDGSVAWTSYPRSGAIDKQRSGYLLWPKEDAA